MAQLRREQESSRLGSHFAGMQHHMGFFHCNGPRFSLPSAEKQGKANNGKYNIQPGKTLGMLLSTFRHKSV